MSGQVIGRVIFVWLTCSGFLLKSPLKLKLDIFHVIFNSFLSIVTPDEHPSLVDGWMPRKVLRMLVAQLAL